MLSIISLLFLYVKRETLIHSNPIKVGLQELYYQSLGALIHKMFGFYS